MHNQKLLLCLIFIFIANISKGQQLENGNPFIYKLSGQEKNTRIDAPTLSSILQLKEGNQISSFKKESDQLGNTIESYNQTFKGIPVEHAIYKTITKGGNIQMISGEYYNLNDLNINPNISADNAFQIAITATGATKYMWDVDGQLPKAKITICKDTRSNTMKLVYKIDIYAIEPLSREWIYIDAKSGEIILRDAIIKHADGTAATRFSGVQTIQTSYSDSTFILKDSTRGNGIQTFDMQHGKYYSLSTDFSDNDNNWTALEYHNDNKDDAALDAHFGMAQTYDYFKNKHNRNSFDGAGAAIKAYVHYKFNYINAFWNGEVLTFGDGGYSASRNVTFEPLTSIDIVAHEFAHGLCQHTAGLVYANESGALNESLSDIWGAAVKYYTDTAKNEWLTGDELNYYFRSLSNPNDRDHPDTYKGDYWYTGSGDGGGVHTNSGVMNHWFYLLVEGGNGVNDNGDAFSVSGIGMDRAAQIVYRMESIYLTNNSGYQDAQKFAVQAAEDIFGNTSNEVVQCIAAWEAVGVYDFASAPTNLVASATNDENGVYVTLTWTDNSSWETGFQIIRYPTSNPIFNLIDTVESGINSYLDTLDAEGGRYAYRIRAISATRKSAPSEEAEIMAGSGVIIMSDTTIQICEGILLDPGGIDNYQNNLNVTLTLSPSVVGKYIELDFEEFRTEYYDDPLRIYDGANTSSPLVGNFHGSSLPTYVSASNSDGKLTLHFKSDNFYTYSGFLANIGCADTIPLPDLVTVATDSILARTVSGDYFYLRSISSNIGKKRSQRANLAAYFSKDRLIDSSDISLDNWQVFDMDPGRSYSSNIRQQVPVKCGFWQLLHIMDD